MKSLISFIAVSTMVVTAAHGAGPEQSAAGLKSAPNTPIVALEFLEQQSGTAGRRTLELAIYEDGRAVVTVPGTSGRRMTGRISRAELKSLLRDLVVERGLLDCRTAHLQKTIGIARRERQRPEPGNDAATTVIRIQQEDSAHEVRCHALGLTASQLPDLDQVRDLYACQQRLENVAAIIRAGGYDNVDAVLSAANRELMREAPQSDVLTSRNLSLVDLRPDGTRYLQFSRTPDLDGLQPVGGFVMVSVYQIPGRPPEITVTADPS